MLVLLAADEMALLVEVVVDVGVDRGELLKGLHPSKSEHRALAPPDGQMTVFRYYGANATNHVMNCDIVANTLRAG